MVTVPFVCPDVPFLKHNPVFFYAADNFQKPAPFKPDVVVSIDSVAEKKLAAIDVMESQFFEGGCLGSAALIPKDRAKYPERARQVRAEFTARFQAWADKFRPQLAEWYGTAGSKQVRCAEGFELCEYGRQPDKAELKRLFPFFN